jgi:glycosyltransferase involved in cell wall biosynthesis
MSEPSASYAALIPALDCATTIGEVVRGCGEHVSLVMVVDDGSSDATAAEARTAGAEVYSHAENRGKGAALLSGLRRLAEHGFSHAASLDGDGQHFPSEIPKLRVESVSHPEALVVGCRQIESEVAAINRFGNEFADVWTRIATGRALADTQCGQRIYPIAPTLALRPVGRRFEFETEILIRAARAGMEIRSVPVRVWYPPPERIVEMVVALMLRLR